MKEIQNNNITNQDTATLWKILRFFVWTVVGTGEGAGRGEKGDYACKLVLMRPSIRTKTLFYHQGSFK